MSIIKLSVYYLIEIIKYLIIFRCILSWLPLGQNRFTEIIGILTDPILDPVKSLMEKTFGYMQIDFSPIILFLILELIQSFIIRL